MRTSTTLAICGVLVACSSPSTLVPDTGGDAFVARDAARTDDAALDTGRDAAASDDASTDAASTDAAVPHGDVLSPCTSDAACASPLVCRAAVTHDGAMRCTHACTSDAECIAGTRCLAEGAEHLCVALDVGRACTSADDCAFACLASQHYCTTTCTTGGDCPAGFGCVAIGAQRVCVDTRIDCTTDASVCLAPAACDASTTLIVPGCTTLCDAASDCPRRPAGLQPWTCALGVCRRPMDVVGPLPGGVPAAYACDAASATVAVCADTHAALEPFSMPAAPAVSCTATTTTAGMTGDLCVDRCLYRGGCADGHACVGLGGATRVAYCLPTGPGEVGAACAHAAECRFGVCHAGQCSRDCTPDGACPSGASCVAQGGGTVEGMPFRLCE